MNRINKKDLEGQLEVINNLTDGTYTLDWAYGGVIIIRNFNPANQIK